MKRRLFIETDILKEEDLERAREKVSDILGREGIEYPDEVFDDTKDFAWHEMKEAWESVKRADEIYGDSALVPIVGGYTGAPVIMDTMMRKTIEEGIEDKSLYFLQPYDSIWWQEIDWKPLGKAFAKNKLFTMEFNNSEYEFVQVDIPKLIKNIKNG